MTPSLVSWRRAAPCLVLALVFMVHGQALWHGFVWDDLTLMLPVEAYRRADLLAILTTRANGYEYLPVRDLTLALDMFLWGPQRPGGFHLANLVILGGVGLAAIATANELFRRHWVGAPPWAAALVGLVVVLHPLSVEPAHFVAARNTLLAALFALLAVRAFLRLWSRDSAPWWLAPFWLLWAALSKASVVGLPALLLFYFVGTTRPADGNRRALPAVIACLIIGGAALFLHAYGAKAAGVINSEAQGFGMSSLGWGLHRAGLISFFYGLKWLWPWPLVTHYDTSWVLKATLPWGMAMHVLPMLLLILCWRRRRVSPVLWFSSLWVAAFLLPVLNLMPTTPVVADRYLFPVQFGLGCALAWGLAFLGASGYRKILAAFVASLLLAWIGVDLLRGREWRDDIALNRATYVHSPSTGRTFYAGVLMEAGREEEALQVLEPDRAWSWRWSLWKGLAADKAGRHDEAVSYYRQAISRGAGSQGVVWFQMGRSFEAHGDWLQAADAYRHVANARSSDDDPFGTHRRQAKAAVQRLLPHTAPGLPELQAHLARSPEDVAGWIRLGALAMQAGDDSLAVEGWEKAHRLQPEHWGISYNLGIAYSRIEAYAPAYDAFLAARSRNTGSAEIDNQLGATAARLGRLEAARGHYREAMGLDPAAFEPAYNLLRLEGRAGRSKAALAALREARRRARNGADKEALGALLVAMPGLSDSTE